jgi:hypothetical protein
MVTQTNLSSFTFSTWGMVKEGLISWGKYYRLVFLKYEHGHLCIRIPQIINIFTGMYGPMETK